MLLNAFTDCIGFYFHLVSEFLMSEPMIYLWVLLLLCAITKVIITIRNC